MTVIWERWMRACCALAASALASACGAEDDAARSDGLVWAIDGEGSTVYLAGSMHLMRESDYPLPATYEDAYQASEQVVFEIPQTGQDAAALQRELTAAAALGEGKTLRDVVPADTYERLEDYLRSAGIPPSAVERFKPWMAALLIAVTEYMKIGARPEFGLDLHFEERAAADGKAIGALETVKFQVELFNSLTADEQREMLVHTMNEIDELPEVTRKLTSAWKGGDEAALAKIMFRDREKFAAMYDALLFDRNEAWIPRIEEIIGRGKPAMVVVGAGHLVGPGSVVDLLEEKGYSVRRLRAKRKKFDGSDSD